MTTARKLIFILLIFSTKTIGQTACEQYFTTLKKSNADGTSRYSQEGVKNRSFRMSTQIKGDTHINYTECDTLGRVHFWGHVGSLKIESYFADGKRYSKIQGDYIKDDEWTFQEVETHSSSIDKSFIFLKNNTQVADCQIIGESSVGKKKCKILAYSVYKWMPKRNALDSFLMEIRVKAWFYTADNLILKYEYETTTERLYQTIKSTIEYDVPVKIELPKNAKQENQKTILLAQKPSDNIKKEIKTSPISTDISKPKDTITVYTTVEQSPEYKEGLTALWAYISKNMHYPEDARKAGVDGTVHISFIVEKDGKLTNIHIKRGLRSDIDSEAIRIVEAMSYSWKAGKIGGKEVRTIYTLPLKFELRE